jgi:hypothetical protein
MKAAWSGRTESRVSLDDSKPPQGYNTVGVGRVPELLTLKCGVPENSTCNCASLSVSTFSTSRGSDAGGVPVVGVCSVSLDDGSLSWLGLDR